MTNRPEVLAVVGKIGPTAHMHENITNEPAYFHRVGSPFILEGPVVTKIRITRDGAGPTGFYDRITVWAGDDLLFESALWMVDHVIYVHDEKANRNDGPFF